MSGAATAQAVAATLAAIRARTPLVHNITNLVVTNSTANALLAVGASPAMVEGLEEVAEFAAVASRNLLRRPVGAECVLDAVAYLIGSSGVIGQTLHVDAGQRFVASGRDVMFERERATHV